MKIKILVLPLLFILSFSCTPKKEQDKIQESAVEEINIIGREVSYSTDSVNMKGYMVYQENDRVKQPGILVLHEWWGHSQYARKRADQLAELGYVAFALDLYGAGKQASHPKEAGELSSYLSENIDEALARFESALETLKENPQVNPEKIGAIGYCFGGTMALSMANTGYDLDVVVAFHAGLKLPIMPSENRPKAKILVANGADDPFITSEHVEDFRAAMEQVGADYKYISYEGALHAFTSPDADSLGKKFNMPLKYHPYADSASWEEMKTLF